MPKGVNQTLSLNGSTMENEIIIRQRINPDNVTNGMKTTGSQTLTEDGSKKGGVFE
ncbi:MAG: hypothetical protein MHPSP_002949, partial [Paramarteilia canceri]